MIKPADWEPSEGLVLEPNAIAAVTETRESIALTAGPGAGKTEMLAQRADFLLRTGLCRYPQRILAISFKVDTSRNLRERVRKRCGPALASRLDSHTFHAFAKRLIDRFRVALSDVNKLDPNYTIGPQRHGTTQIGFDDMVPFAVEILSSCGVALNAVRQTYSHVFLDEFQDCTKSQYKLIKEAFGETEICLTAVGDTKQRIMGWAGALEGIFATFASDFDARGLNLYQNFRSLPRLRRMQNAMVKVMDPQSAVLDSKLAGEGGDIDTLVFDDSEEEAAEIANIIQEWISQEALDPCQIAVLVARQPELYAEALMRELDARHIAYRNEQKLQELATEPIAQLIIDLLTVVIRNRDPDAYVRLMGMLRQADLLDETHYSLHRRLEEFLDGSRKAVANGAISMSDPQMLRALVDSFADKVGRESLMALSADYERGNRMDQLVDEVLARLGELLAADCDLDAALSRFSEDKAVRIMTIHKSKGLEFDTVVVLGVEEETFWAKVVEERPVFFVAIARAKRRLRLTVCGERPRPRDHSGRWTEQRSPHKEFLSYAAVE